MSIWNIIVASSNIAALFPLSIAWQHKDLTTFLCLTFIMLASCISHIFASHKHGQTGFGCLRKVSKFLNYVDCGACVIISLRLVMLYIFLDKDKKFSIVRRLGLSLLCCLILNVLSGWDQSAASRVFFTITHSFWHILIFVWIGAFLQAIY